MTRFQTAPLRTQTLTASSGWGLHERRAPGATGAAASKPWRIRVAIAVKIKSEVAGPGDVISKANTDCTRVARFQMMTAESLMV